MFRSLSAITILLLLITVNLPPDASGLASRSEGNWTGSPAPNYILFKENPIEGLTPFYLDYEKIIFTVSSENKASVDLEFTLRNSANESLVASFYIYFEARVPGDMECYVNGTALLHTTMNLSHSQLPPRAALFYYMIQSNESASFHVTYNIRIQSILETKSTGLFGSIKNTVQTSRYLYVGSLGRYWNGTVTDAKMEFRIAKDLYRSGCDGWDLQEHTGHNDSLCAPSPCRGHRIDPVQAKQARPREK
jgi:hypothetical protein